MIIAAHRKEMNRLDEERRKKSADEAARQRQQDEAHKIVQAASRQLGMDPGAVKASQPAGALYQTTRVFLGMCD